MQASGKVEERLGNITGARSLYGESLRLEPSAPTLVSFALLELNNPRQEQANFTYVRDLFEEALILDPRHGAAYNAYGNAEYEAGNIVEARRVFQRGLQANCSDIASLYHGFGKVELSLGNVEKARDILEIGLNEVRSKGVATDSTNRDRTKFLSHTLGMLELNLNRPTTALETFQEGIERCGNSSRLLLGAALSEMKLGKDDAARELFEKSVLSDERHAQAWQAWGVMETKAGNFKTASALFQCGIRNVPSYGPLWHGFALLEQKKDEIHNARVLYASGLQKAPRSVALYQGWALLELRQGNYIDARKLIAEALTRNKKNGHCWLVAAGIEEESGNGGLVSLILRRGIECAPNDAELYRKLGDYLVGKGKVEDAREVFEKGMELNPMYAPLYHSLAELEARVFNLEALSKLNRRAAELFHTNALEPPKYSSEAFATKIRAKRTRAIPEGIAVLAEKIVEEFDDGRLLSIDDIGKVDPSVALESLSGSLMEDEFVGDLLQDD